MTMPHKWPDWLNDVWAKSADKGAGGEPETLATHTWSVVEKLAETIRLRPDLPKQIGVPRLWHILFWAAFLHDFGKAANGFQSRLRGGPKWAHRHEVLSLAFVDWITSAFSDEEQRWLVAAIASHHRDAGLIQQLYNDDVSVDQVLVDLVKEVDESVVHGLWRWLSECPSSWIEALNLTDAGIEMPTLPNEDDAVRLARDTGATIIRKWLKAYRRWLNKSINDTDDLSLLTGTILLRGHLISSDHMASAHVGELPTPQLADAKVLLADWKLTIDDLYEHQRKSMNTRGSAILMAPTGSGKTESSLLWAVSQGTDGRSVPRLYYTLPFQASMNAMHKRLNDDEKNENDEIIRDAPFKDQVGLEHSRSTLAYYRRLFYENENADPKQVSQSAFRLKDLARLSYYPVRVLSPYQLLKAPYRLKGYETLLTDCFGATFVFDEVHAYDAGRLAKILALVKFLRENYGAKFFVMSATLPNLLRERLKDALGDYTALQASPDVYAKFRRHKLVLKDGDLTSETNLKGIAEVAESGQAVLVCCNTVKRTQTAYSMLQQQLQDKVEIVLLHGRFNGKDRLEKEKIVEDRTGARSSNRRPIVLVATQVVEVSLNIDLDMIYTDPAPLEALLQRFGRVNRRRLKEHAPVYVFREPVPEKKQPYDPKLINVALTVLAKHEGKLIDESQVSNWLDEVYSDPIIAEEWTKEYDREARDFADRLLELRAFQSTDNEDEFYKAFDSVEVLPEGLLNDYLSSREKSYLEASQFFVSISNRQYGRLYGEGRGRFDTDLEIRLVDVHYDSEVGLDYSRMALATPKDVWESD